MICMNKIIITGSGGFLGQTLLYRLADELQYEVIALTTRVEELKKIFASCSHIKPTYTEIFLKQKLTFDKDDILVNCAFPRNGNGEQMADGLQYISRILSCAMQNCIGAVINISSQSVYSSARLEPATEQTGLDLETRYAVGKYATELLTNMICGSITHTNLRLASLIGPAFDERITNKFVAQALNGKDLHIIGGIQQFGFLDVLDAAEGLIAVLKSDPVNWQEVYNFGINKSYTITEIAACVCELSKTYCKKPIQFSIQADDVILNSTLDCNLFMKDFGWNPSWQLYDSIKRIFEDQVKNYGNSYLMDIFG